MYEDLKQLVNLKYGKEAERLSREYQEQLMIGQRQAAARGNSAAANILKLRLGIELSERTIRSLADSWLDAILRRDHALSRDAVTFILNEIGAVAAARKAGAAQLFGAGSQSTHAQQEMTRGVDRIVANIRRDLEIKLQEQALFPVPQPATGQSTPTATKKTDGLLPLFDRSEFDADLSSHTSSASEDFPLSLIFFDIDNFKSINDKLGHAAGDKALCSVAEVLLRVCKGKGAPYRFGGDEFCVILANFSSAEAAEVADRIRLGVAEVLLETHNLSTSVGVASYPKPCANAGGLLDAADKAMYASKSAGGNRVSTAQAEAVESESKPSKARITPEQLQDRIAAVDLELSIDQGTQYFVTCIENKSDEEVRVKKIKLSYQGVRITEAPAPSPKANGWDIAPRARLPISWNAMNDPCGVLMGLVGVFDKPVAVIVEVFLQAEVLGRLRTFDTQRIQVQTDPGAHRIWQVR